MAIRLAFDGEHLGCGIQRGWAAFVYFTQELDDFPDVWPVGEGGPTAGRPVFEDHPWVVGHPQSFVDEPLR